MVEVDQFFLRPEGVRKMEIPLWQNLITLANIQKRGIIYLGKKIN